MLQVKNLVKTFSTAGGSLSAVNGVSFVVSDNSFASIIGKSGSGKSTLLALLGGLDKPSSGSIEVDSIDLTKLRDHELIAYRCKAIGFIFQNYNLVPNLTAIENVMLPMEFAHIKSSKRKSRAQELLNKVGIEGDKQLRKPGKLSGGEQQRVAIARALANEPKLILADEPTGNLDSENGKKIFNLLHDLARTQKATIITVTHDLSIAGKTSPSFKLQDGKLQKK